MARYRPDNQEDDLIAGQFRAFIGELTNVQTRLADAHDTDPEAAAQGLHRHLLNLLEIQTLQSRRDSTRFEMENVADARYLKAVLADEGVGRDHRERGLSAEMERPRRATSA